MFDAPRELVFTAVSDFHGNALGLSEVYRDMSVHERIECTCMPEGMRAAGPKESTHKRSFCEL